MCLVILKMIAHMVFSLEDVLTYVPNLRVRAEEALAQLRLGRFTLKLAFAARMCDMSLNVLKPLVLDKRRPYGMYTVCYM